MPTLIILIATLLIGGAAIAAPNAYDLSIGDPARKNMRAPVVLDGVTDTKTGEVISLPDLPARLKGVRVLLVGEQHTDMEFHRVQLQVIKALVASGRQVLIGLEMFPYSSQKVLYKWSLGRLSESDFLTDVDWYGTWSHPWRYYREIFLLARDQRIALYGINVPHEVVSQARTKGFDGISKGVEGFVPPSFDTSSQEYRTLIRAFFESGDAMHGRLTDEQFEGMFRGQVAWDGSMAWNAVRCLEKHGGKDAIMVVLIGFGHVAYGLGAQYQAARWSKEPFATLIPVSVVDDSGKAVPSVNAAFANFICGVPRDTAHFPSLGVTLGGAVSDPRTKIFEVSEGSVAKRAGVQVGDVLTSIDGKPVASPEEIARIVGDYSWGDKAELKLTRAGKEVLLTVYFRRVLP